MMKLPLGFTSEAGGTGESEAEGGNAEVMRGVAESLGGRSAEYRGREEFVR
jgi:hypothetical protein